MYWSGGSVRVLTPPSADGVLSHGCLTVSRQGARLVREARGDSSASHPPSPPRIVALARIGYTRSRHAEPLISPPLAGRLGLAPALRLQRGPEPGHHQARHPRRHGPRRPRRGLPLRRRRRRGHRLRQAGRSRREGRPAGRCCRRHLRRGRGPRGPPALAGLPQGPRQHRACPALHRRAPPQRAQLHPRRPPLPRRLAAHPGHLRPGLPPHERARPGALPARPGRG